MINKSSCSLVLIKRRMLWNMLSQITARKTQESLLIDGDTDIVIASEHLPSIRVRALTELVLDAEIEDVQELVCLIL